MAESLAASRDARRRYLSSRRSVAALRSPSPIIQAAEKSVVVKAGRFSVPSDDIMLSPTRQLSSSPAHTQHRKTATGSAKATIKSIDWPAVDPVGEPIQWKVRDPFIFDIRSHSPHSDSETNKKINKRDRTKDAIPNEKYVVHWGRVFFCAALFFGLYVGISSSYSASPSFLYPLKKLFIRPPYCDDEQQPPGCRPCPDNALCSGHQIACRKPQFILQRSGWEWVCVKDHTSYRGAHKLLERLSRYLSQQQGALRCGTYLGPTYEIGEGTRVAFKTRHTLEGILSKGPRNPQIEAEFIILFDELMQQSEQMARLKLASAIVPKNNIPYEEQINAPAQVELYYSTQEYRPVSCIIRESVEAHLIKVASVSIIGLSIFVSLRKQQTRRRALRSVKRIIAENTKIQQLDGKRGYATGPRAHDIRVLLYGQQKDAAGYFGDRVLLNLTDTQLQRLCDEVVRIDSDFSKSVLAIDMIPFYYSKKVIESLKIKKC